MRYVRVDNGVAVEEGEYDSIEGRFHPSLLWIASDTAKIGDLWDGQAFTAPPAPPVVVPQSVIRRKAMAVLIKYGIDTQVDAALAAQLSAATASGDPDAILTAKFAINDWKQSQQFERTWPLIAKMQAVFGWTDAYVDGLFIEAETL